MSIPKCLNCLQKHLSDAVSLAHEIINGHSAGGNPDHRVDFSGELIEAEKHASLLDKTLSLKIRHLRRSLQSQRWKPTADDIDHLRVFWNVSFAIDGEEELAKIKNSDAEFYDLIIKSIKIYGIYQQEPDQSDVSKTCSCERKKDSETLKNEMFSSDTNVIYISKSKISEQLKQNIISNVSGISSIIQFSEHFAKWPKKFIEDNLEVFSKCENSIMCLWPSDVMITRKTNVLAFPSIIDETKQLSESDRFYCETKLSATPKKFFTIPLYVTPSMLVSLCEDYEKVVKKTEIDDIYSIIRNFDNSPFFDNKNKIFASIDEEQTSKTLFIKLRNNE